MKRAGPAALVCALGLAACAPAGTATPRADAQAPAVRPATVVAESLVGTRWVGVVAGNPDPRTLPRLEFVREGRLSGFTGCNLMNGAWSLDAGEVRLGPIATTKRACLGPEGEVESRLVAAMGGKVTREGGKLVLTGPDGARFEFTPAQVS